MSFDDASAYRMKRRQIEPAIYNHRRLFEQPIPSLIVETASASDFNNYEDQLNEFSDADDEFAEADDELLNADHDEPFMEFKAEPESVIELAEEDIDG